MAGTIQFLDSEGADEVTHISLNGPAATVGFQLRITDKDLDVTIKREGEDADVLDDSRLSSGMVQPLEGEEWFDLQDMNGDGRIDIRDIRALDSSGASTVTDTESIWYDRTNGILRVPANTAMLEYWIKTRTTLGSGSGSSAQGPGSNQQGMAVYNSLTHGNDIPAPDGHSLLQENYGWIDVLEARFEGLKERQDTILVQSILEASVRAYNETKAIPDEGDLLVNAFFTPASTDGQTPASVTFRVFNGETIGEPGDPGFQQAAEVGAGPGGQASNVVVEYEYWGSSDSAYPDRSARPTNTDSAAKGQVTVSTYAAPRGINASLQETHATSGVFASTIVICEAGHLDCIAEQGETIRLPVFKDGDSIEVTYEDDSPSVTRTETLPLDVNGPSFALFSPASGHAGRDDEPTVSFQVTDVASGLSNSDDAIDTIYVVAGLYDLEAERSSDSVVFERRDLDLSDVIDGYSASVTIDEGRNNADQLDSRRLTDNSQYEIRWWAVSSDKAGNISVSDSDNETGCAIPTDTLADFRFDAKRSTEQANAITAALEKTIDFQEGCDPHIIRVDNVNPSLERAVTGSWLDADGVEKEGPNAIRTSIAAVFDEAVDCTTVAPYDFTVDGIAPSAVACKDSTVYLTVAELVSDETPTVRVSEGAVSDRAGNLVDASPVTAEDSIPAKLTVTLTGTSVGDTRPLTRRTIIATVNSDESLSSPPIVTINRVGDDYSLIRASQGEAIPSGEPNRWVYTAALSKDGLYNVRTSGVDKGGRIETAIGLDETEFDPTSLKDSKTVLFEVDTNLRPPTFWPEDDATTENPNTFIKIHFGNEHAEYGLTGEIDNAFPPPAKIRKATDDPSMVNVSFDTHTTVTLTKAIFNGEDVTREVISRDDVTFTFHRGELPLGDYRLELEATDSAGNRWADTLNFTVIERQPFRLPINPGLNLISLPAEPENGSIDAILGELAEITTVVTYDNPTNQWLTAARDESGSFSGDLSTIDADHGYFIVSEAALTLEVMLARVDDILILPHLEVYKGWNLVPVVDTNRRPAGTAIEASQYFANIDATAASGFDSTGQMSTRHSLATDSNDRIAIGSAYWVYANVYGVIVP